MKSLFWTVLLGIMVLCSCSKDDDSSIQPPVQQETILFDGNWTRQFEVGSGNLHTVLYSIYQDSIRYTLTGPIGNANYVMIRDAFKSAENRYVGHTPENKFYVMFAKDVSDQSITIYKQEVSSVDEGLNLPVPSASTSQNYGWNTFNKQ